MTSEQEAIGALQDAADRVGGSPTKQQYEDLDISPSSYKLIQMFGSWNQAKEAANLEAYDRSYNSGGEVEPKPEDVQLPDDVEWEELSANQRWYYKNREEQIAAQEERRLAIQEWFREFKAQFECAECGEDRTPCIDFHHESGEEKDAGVAELVRRKASRERIRREARKCTPLCANCHRVIHADS